MLSGVDAVRSEESAAPAADGRTAALPILSNGDDTRRYQCPGERRPISRAVHLSRLAAFSPACRECEHRSESGSLSQRRVEKLQELSDRRAPRDIFHRDGIRGVHLNDITRDTAARLAEAAAGVLWDGHLKRGRADHEDPAGVTRSRGPVAVLGRDGRASAWDIATGVAIGLRRMGCDVVDAGVLSGPALDFAVYHLRADAGVRVTGAGSASSWSGIDLVDSHLAPWSLEGRLSIVQDRWRRPANRPTRHGGSLSSCDIRLPRRAMLLRHAHALRVRRVGLAVADPSDRHALGPLLEDALRSIQLLDESAAWAAGDPATSAARRQWRALIREHELACGFVIAEDGRRCSLIDEQGRLIPPEDWFVRLAESILPQRSVPRVVVSAEVSGVCRGRLKAHGAEVIQSTAAQEDVVTRLLAGAGALAADGQGRVWFQDHYPICDGLVTLMHLLRVLGESGQPVSQWAK